MQRVKMEGIKYLFFLVFAITGIEPLFPGLLANILTIMPMIRC